jgi:hypothetical protein
MSTEKKQSEQQTGADIVVKTLEQRDVKWIFGVPGAKIDKVFNTLADSSIKTVVCRHEQNATFIAGGHWTDDRQSRSSDRYFWPRRLQPRRQNTATG